MQVLTHATQHTAIVLLRPEFAPSDALAQELLGFTRDRLASFKAPRSLHFVAELPRGPHLARSSGTGYARRSG